MSEETRHVEVREKTQQLLRGSLKHVRAAALAAVLVPLASVAIGPVVAGQGQSGGTPVIPPTAGCDFATSGGFVIGDDGKKASFGAHGGCKNGAFWGHVNYIDHLTGYHLNSIEITAYGSPNGANDTTIRDICGVATSNGAEPQPVFFRVRIIDNGEPGVADQFGIATSNGYRMTTRLLNNGVGGGGDVQLHKGNPSTTAPDPLPSGAAACNGIIEP